MEARLLSTQKLSPVHHKWQREETVGHSAVNKTGTKKHTGRKTAEAVRWTQRKRVEGKENAELRMLGKRNGKVGVGAGQEVLRGKN